LIVRCSNCQTQFSLDDAQVGPDGAPVRCSVCAYVFRVDAPSGRAPLPWQVRTVEDLMWSAADLGTLRSWITEGRLHPDDRISRTGKNWIRLGDMPEFSDAFGGFADLPSMVSPVTRPMADDASDLGPPPDFAGGEVAGVVERVPQDSSHGIDVSGLLGPLPPPPPSRTIDMREHDLDDEPTVARPAPTGEREDVVVRRRAERPRAHEAAKGRRDASGTARVHRDDVGGPEPRLSEMEDSGAVRLPPPPPPPPAPPSRRKRSAPTPPETPAQGLLLAPEPLPPAPTPPPRPMSMLGAVTAHVKPITAPPSSLPDTSESSDVSPSVSRESRGGMMAAEPSYADAVVRPRRRSAWPLWAGLGLLCGAAVVFGIPQIRERVLGSVGDGDGDAAEPPAAIADARAAIAAGDPAALEAADAGLTKALESELPAEHHRTVSLVLVEVLATRALVFQLQAGLEGEDPRRRSLPPMRRSGRGRCSRASTWPARTRTRSGARGLGCAWRRVDPRTRSSGSCPRPTWSCGGS
jgi:predicted Zn finger-like uncharacterized protein